MESLDKGEANIQQLVQRCTALFEQLLSTLSTRPGSQYQIVLNHNQRFQIWVDRVGVLKNQADDTLELRLQHKSVILGLVNDLLTIVEYNLTRVFELESHTHQSSQSIGVASWIQQTFKSLAFSIASSREGVDSDQLSPASQVCLDGVKGSIERLQDLVPSIPKPSKDEHAFVSLGEDNNNSYLVDSEKSYRKLMIHGLLMSQFPNINKSVLNVLEKTIEVRREALANIIQASSKRETEIAVKAESESQRSDLQIDLNHLQSAISSAQEPSLVYNFEVIYDIVSTQGDAKEAREFGPHSVYDIAEVWKKKWAGIKPFICLVEKCHSSDSFFADFSEWQQHMEVVHSPKWLESLETNTKWFCDSDEGEYEEFCSIWDLETHVKSTHNISSIELTSMIEHNVVNPASKPNQCPLCQDTYSDIYRHIASHLGVLAFLSVRFLDPRKQVMPDIDTRTEHAHAEDSEKLSTVFTRKRDGNLTELNFSSWYLDDEIAADSEHNSERGPLEDSLNPALEPPVVLEPLIERPPISLKELRIMILDSLIPSELDARPFLPLGERKKIITNLGIEDLRAWGDCSQDYHSLLQFIQNDAPILFAILVAMRIDVLDALCSLYKFGLTDKFLPISKETLDDSCDRRDRKRHRCQHEPALDVFHNQPWDFEMMHLFGETQWRFLAPVFIADRYEYNLKTECILPITYLGEKHTSSFSFVTEVEIHPDHHDLHHVLGQTNRIALKQLMDPSDSTAEAKAQKMINGLHHDNILSAFASIERGRDQFLLFPWADGGNLREFWLENDIWPLTDAVVTDVLGQLLGLCDGLWEMHESYFRHGDLKPENIVRFLNDKPVGLLKLADMGLAKKHEVSTEERFHSTETKLGTLRYEPPEAAESREQPRSRRYDIWSMGCIVLEFIIWAQYGPAGLRAFNRRLATKDGKPAAYYTIPGTSNDTGRTKAVIHEGVDMWLKQILEDPFWPVDTSLGDLARLVQTRLLVVDLPSRETSHAEIRVNQDDDLPIVNVTEASSQLIVGDSTFYRADSEELKAALQKVVSKSRIDPYYRIPNLIRELEERPEIPEVAPEKDLPHLIPLASEDRLVSAINSEYRISEMVRLKDSWGFPVDNDFALKFMSRLSLVDPDAENYQAPRLCGKCASLNLDRPDFTATYTLSYLKLRKVSFECDLCDLFYQAVSVSGLNSDTVRFMRDGSIIKLQDEGRPVLSLVIPSPSAFIPQPTNLQLGFPAVTKYPEEVSYELMRYWLETCDTCHSCMTKNPLPGLPPVLIDIGASDFHSRFSLCKTNAMENSTVRYNALSFIWGSQGSKLRDDGERAARLGSIDFNEMPATCRDAIQVTRRLGVRYLWIDAYCMSQPDGKIVIEEIGKMETIFTNAYCILAASSAKGADEGFLTSRPRRASVPFPIPGKGTIVVCEMIDDFSNDVQNSLLNSRGWTLEERILAPRTIVFTPTQIYWQCGEAIRTETLTRLRNSRMDIFFSGNDFPKLALEKLHHPHRVYQALYERYSRLKFSYQRDKLHAIAGLEGRLLRTFKSKGGYGIFEKYLCRSLLWRRDLETPLARIDYKGSELQPPSWSWMAYSGGISYFDLPLGGIDWGDVTLHGPLDIPTSALQETSPDNATSSSAIVQQNNGGWFLTAQASKFEKTQISDVFYDCSENEERKFQLCVVLGRQTVGRQGSLLYYLLIIGPRHDEGEKWERLGVGYAESDDPLSLELQDRVVIM